MINEEKISELFLDKYKQMRGWGGMTEEELLEQSRKLIEDGVNGRDADEDEKELLKYLLDNTPKSWHTYIKKGFPMTWMCYAPKYLNSKE